MNQDRGNLTPTYLIDYTVVLEGDTVFRQLEISAFNAKAAIAAAIQEINKFPYLQPKIYSIARL